MKRNGLCSTESSSTAKIKLPFDKYRVYGINRVVGWHELKELLAPKHSFFKGKEAYIDYFYAYKPEESSKYLLYPKVSGKTGERMPKENPYRKHQIARSNTARRIDMMFNLVNKFKLSEFNMAFLTITMPKEISVALSEKKTGVKIAWLMYEKFWKKYNDIFGENLASSVNLHTWKTELPFEPHYHFHMLIPNYRIREVDLSVFGGENNEDSGDTGYEFVRQEWHRQRGGKYVPVSEQQLEQVRKMWTEILKKYSRLNHVEVDWEKKVDIHYAYGQLNDGAGKIQVMHWFNYQGRYPLEDYAKYSNKNPGCPNPPEWLKKYTNRARSYGWWLFMGKIAFVKKEVRKVNPLSGEIMEYVGRLNLYDLLARGRLGFLDIVKGKPVYHRLNGREIMWLVKIQKKFGYS
jgi:hypothetical protein